MDPNKKNYADFSDGEKRFHKFQHATLLLASICLIWGCAASNGKVSAKGSQSGLSQGVEPISLDLTGSGHFIDFRFRVTDPNKATTVLDRKEKAYLIDVETGTIMPVSVTKIGSMRSSTQAPKANRTYVVLFSNIQKELKTGDRATVVIGAYKAENLVVGKLHSSILDVDTEKRQQWEAIQHLLLGEYRACNDRCSGAQACGENCRHVYHQKSDTAYQNLFIH